ncbi:transcriptional regulator [Streptomyces sp. NBS 14/10]|uniref:helix-turn-helix domain-containing protein n=1 Tax=Streptomyces sp. NBS 14/10 TaxID=1945643 RepID=UPI000B7C5E61|nr:helix-turn-helix domain-containing protein [Streptomyces sp. NBS 14/10]KAK1181615.1 transcriptional regulator [Streptomyces sp. NBS 14/10]
MDGRIPLPHDVKDSTEFVAVMRQLRQWADLSYRELERRAGAAGDVLPRATLAGALNRQELPREELVAAFVRACGGDEATVEAWVGVRKRLAVEVEQEPADAEEPSPTVEAESVAEDLGPVAEGRPGPVAEGPQPVAEGPQPVAEDPEPVADTAPDPEPESSPRTSQPEGPEGPTQPKGLKAAGRRLRRPGVIIAATVAIVLLTAAATAILRPGDRPDEPREGSRTEAPANTTRSGPSDTPSHPSGGATSSAADAKPAKDEPSATEKKRETSSAPTPTKTTAPKKPKPSRSSPTSQWTPYDPPSLPDDPPPTTDTSPTSDGGDPFPEETCWDATNDCT